MYNIMVVDSDSTTLTICKALLGQKYRVMLEHSGVQALGGIKEGHIPDLILLDLDLRGMSGLEVLKTLQEDEKTAHIPVIFTGKGKSGFQESECYGAGAVDFVQKPLDNYILLLKVEQQLTLITMQKENDHLRKILHTIKKQLVNF